MADGKEEETALGEIKKGEEANIVNIVMKNLVNKYQKDARVLKLAKVILKESKNVPESTMLSVISAINELKENDLASYLEQVYSASHLDME